MATAAWPTAEKRLHIGKHVLRLDGPEKATGAAKYSYDKNLPGMLWAKLVGSEHPRAKIISVDTSAAEALPGVKAAWKDDNLIGNDVGVNYAGQIIAAVAAESEEAAQEAAKLVKVQYEVM